MYGQNIWCIINRIGCGLFMGIGDGVGYGVGGGWFCCGCQFVDVNVVGEGWCDVNNYVVLLGICYVNILEYCQWFLDFKMNGVL